MEDFYINFNASTDINKILNKYIRKILISYGFVIGDSNDSSVIFFKETLGYISCIDYILASYDLTCYASTATIANRLVFLISWLHVRKI